MPAHYRQIVGALLTVIAQIEKENRARQIAVLLLETVKEHWRQYLLHAPRSSRLCRALLRCGGSRLMLISVPGYLEEPRIEQGLEQEEVPDRIREKVS